MSAVAAFAGRSLRTAVRLFVRLYYPRIEVAGREHIPRSGPILLVANHANSLIDPVMIGIAAQRPVRFLAKAPLFDVPVLGPTMRALGMLPAFRGMDDPSQIKRNLDTLTAGAEYMVKGDAVGLFPEGKSHDSLKIEMIRSGAARMALQAVKYGAADLQIVPLGINYERKERFQSAVWIRVGEPVHANQVIAEHGDQERRALRGLTQEIERRLKEVVIHLAQGDWAPFLDYLEVIFPPPSNENGGSIAALRQRKRVADAMNHFLATDPSRAESLAGALDRHCQRLAGVGLQMDSPIVRFSGWRLWWRMAWTGLSLAFGVVPVLLATVHHLIPFLVVRGLSWKFQAPGKATTSLTRLSLGLPIYAVWYVWVWFWISARAGTGLAWIWVLAMPFAGVFALSYWRRACEVALLWWREI